MGKEKKLKKKCCGKFTKKGKHCSSCPISGRKEKCNPNKEYCKGCDLAPKSKKDKKDKKKARKKDKKKKT